MFAQLTNKQKLKWLAGGGIFTFLLSYELAIRPTLVEYRRHRLNAETAQQNGRPGSAIGSLKARDITITGIYDQFLLDTVSSDKNLLSIVSNYCKAEHVQLKEYKPLNVSQGADRRVLTRIVAIQGRFIPCLRLVNQLERVNKAGRVSSVEFRTYNDPQDKQLKMDCLIYVQNIMP